MAVSLSGDTDNPAAFDELLDCKPDLFFGQRQFPRHLFSRNVWVAGDCRENALNPVIFKGPFIGDKGFQVFCKDTC
jgi:hypothetical protein